MFGRRIGIELGSELGIDLGANSDAAAPGVEDLIALADRVAWFRSDSGVTSAASRVSAWANIWGNGDLAQATGGNQMLLVANAVRTFPAIYSDDAARFMVGTLTTPVASGTRVFEFVYAYATGLTDTNGQLAFGTRNAAATRFVFITTNTGGAGGWSVSTNATGSISTRNGPAQDLSPHLFEFGNSSTAQITVSGTSFTGTDPGACNANLDTVDLGNRLGFAQPLAFLERIIMRGTPTAYVKAQMRRYFQARYGTI